MSNINNKKTYNKTNNTAEEAKKEGIPVDTTDETKKVEEFVGAKSESTEPVYSIRVELDNTATQKESFTDIDKAIKECNKYPGYKVFNEKGDAIHFSTAAFKSANNVIACAGKRCDLVDTKLFASSTIETPNGLLTGTYYLYDAKLINGRYRVVNNKEKVGKGIQFIMGYIAIEEM